MLGDKIGNKQTCFMCFIAMSLAMLYLLIASGLQGLFIVCTTIGFCFAGIGALMAPLTADYFGLKSHGMILGIIYASDMLGGAIGPVTAGRIFDLTSSYNLAFLSSSVIAVIGSILILLLR